MIACPAHVSTSLSPAAARRGALAALVVAGLIAALPASGQVVELSAVAGGAGGGFVLNGEAANDEAGFSVSSAGDVNGDGRSDLLVAAASADPAAGANAGRVYVVFGKSSLAGVDLSAVASGTSTLGFVINGQQAGELAGYSVSAAGDVNGDGLGDVIVGAPLSDQPPATTTDNRGRVFVVFGKTTASAVDLTEVATGTSSAGFMLVGEAAGDRAGNAVGAAGDVNGDGMNDVIIAAPLADPGGRVNAGRAYVVFGNTSGSIIQLSDVSPGLLALGFVINGEDGDQPGNDFGDQAGRSVASAGDVNGDGLADVVVGALRNDPLGRSNAGSSYVVFGKTASGAVELTAVAAGAGGLGFAIRGEAADDQSGRTVSGAGDVNGDGLADVIVGAADADATSGTPPRNPRGRSFVVFGKSTTTAIDLANVSAGSAGLGFMIQGQAAADYSGWSVSSAGDVNGDGRGDVLVGADLSDPPAGASAGRTYVVFGKSTTTSVALSAVATGTSALGFVVQGGVAGEQSGRAVSSLGDANGDGLSDLVLGAAAADPGAVVNAGRAYVVFSPLVPATTATLLATIGPGDAPRQGVGTNRFGSGASAFPDGRLWLDFNGGNGTGGPGTSSTSTVTLKRNDTGITGFSASQLADVQWQVVTGRQGWTSCRATVRYTDAEIAGLSEGSLVLYTALSAAGPFSPAGGFTLDTARNEASGTFTTPLAVLVLVGTPPATNGDANNDGARNVADLTAIHNQLAGITAPPLPGDGDVDNDADVDINDANALREFLVNGTPLP